MPELEPLQNFLTELRRGSLTLAVLGSLREPRYGYALLQTLQEQQIDIEANTLYPLLRRLESQGLLTSDWDTSQRGLRAVAEGMGQHAEEHSCHLREGREQWVT